VDRRVLPRNECASGPSTTHKHHEPCPVPANTHRGARVSEIAFRFACQPTPTWKSLAGTFVPIRRWLGTLMPVSKVSLCSVPRLHRGKLGHVRIFAEQWQSGSSPPLIDFIHCACSYGCLRRHEDCHDHQKSHFFSLEHRTTDRQGTARPPYRERASNRRLFAPSTGSILPDFIDQTRCCDPCACRRPPDGTGGAAKKGKNEAKCRRSRIALTDPCGRRWPATRCGSKRCRVGVIRRQHRTGIRLSNRTLRRRMSLNRFSPWLLTSHCS